MTAIRDLPLAERRAYFRAAWRRWRERNEAKDRLRRKVRAIAKEGA